MSLGRLIRTAQGLSARFKGFLQAERGSVTLQVLFMSIALMGTTGLVLDSGRLYTKHTQMQAFVDQMALAAASELDGRSDSIERARDAVGGLGGTAYLSKFDSQGNEFRVAWMGFYTDLPPEYTPASDRQNDISDLLPYLITDETDDENARAARYVAVVAVQWKVGNLVGPLSRIVTPRDEYCADGNCEPSGIPEQTDVQTVAVAAMERVTCADLSTLVFCNPWEGRADDYDDQATIPGRTIRYFAPNFAGAGQEAQEVTPGFTTGTLGSPWSYDARNQLHLLVDPVSDPPVICGLDFVLGFSGDREDDASLFDPDYLEARDRCLLARARAETMCFEEKIGIRPAPGPLVLEGVNVAFDIWLPPMDELLVAGTFDQDVPNTGLPLATFFEPDVSVLSRFWTVDDNGGIFSAAVEYETIPAPDWTNRNNFPVRYATCHIASYSTAIGSPSAAACSVPLVSDTATIGRSQRTPYRNAVYRDNDTGSDPAPASTASFTTWYELYQIERANALVDPDPAISQVRPNAATLLGLTPARTSARPTYEYGAPNTYLEATGLTDLVQSGHERRRIRAAMVNCLAMYDEDETGYIDDPDPADGIPGSITYWYTPIMAILDVHLPEPAGMHCGLGVPNCEVDESVETSLMIELIEDVTDEAFSQRFAVSLVR